MTSESSTPKGYDQLTGTIDKEYRDALARLELAQGELQHRIYADGYGPLSAERIDPEARNIEAFSALVERYGWPTIEEDAIITGPQEYDSGAEFVASLPIPTAFGPRHLTTHQLFLLMSRPPRRDYDPREDATGLVPVKHRAHAVAPDFFDALQDVLHTLGERFHTLSDEDHVYEEIMRSENKLVQESMYDGYRIMGRLLKVHDPGTTLAIMRAATGYDSGRPARVTLSADDELRYSA